MDNKNIAENSKNDIKAALDKLMVGYVDAKESDSLKKNEVIEFDFSDEHDTGLVFEDETAILINEEAVDLNNCSSVSSEEGSSQNNCFDASGESSPKDFGVEDENADQEASEFSVPDEFEIGERFNTPEVPTEQTRIWSTYVPRFTEISDTYRMVDDPRPRPESSSAAIAVPSDDFTPDKQDPTAEIDPDTEEAVVNVGTIKDVKLEDFSESINVYKFSDGASEDVPRAGKAAFSFASNEELDKAAPRAELTEKTSFEAESESESISVEEQELSVSEQEYKSTHERRGNVEIPDPDVCVNVVDMDTHLQRGALEKYEIPPHALTPAPLPPQYGKKERLSEYTAFYQRDSFKDKFLDSILSVKIRLFSLVFISLMLLVYENLSIFGVDIAKLLHISGARGATSLIDLHLSFCAFALALPEIIAAIKLLLKKKLTPEIFILPSFAVIVATVIWDYVSIDESPALFGFVLSIQALSAVIASCIRKNADFTAFKAVSQNGDKKVLDVSETKNLPKENIALDGAVDSYKSRTVRLFRTSFISDFFKHTSERCEDGFASAVVLAVSFGAASVISLISGLLVGGINSAFDSFALMFMSAIPAAAILVHKLPYVRAEKISNDNKTVVIGESALYDFSEVDVITFDDTEIFGEEDVALKRFMSYGDKENTAKAMYQMSALFSVVGGPLDSIFTKSLAGKRPAPATNIIIDDDGIQASVDGKRVHAGTYEYMIRCGISVSSESGAQQSSGADTTKVMYAAEDGNVYAKFYIRYSFSESFTEILPSIRAQGIVPLIYTRDPNISNELLKTLGTGQGTIRVMKKNDIPPLEEKSYTRIGAGIVTFGNKMNAIKAVLLSKKYSSLQDKLSKAELVLMSAGALAAAVLSLLGIAVPSLGIAIWQSALCVALAAASVRGLEK